ncbi:class I SAM-dependent methyltransferase [Amycolatopsis sp. NPDC059021]|uniref:class I SAM-dependent methyltransferase n=1 Tax=Amycolatopsis sp. NPDC059021 TaxID=3346704 RepID=UPI0036716AE4
MRGELTDQTYAAAGHLEAFVDEHYLDACAHAWEITSELAQSILDAVDGDGVDPADEHRVHCLDWLRRAATYRMLPRSTHVATSSAGALAPTVDLLRHAASAYPRFIESATSGWSVLFAGEGMRLWNSYFHSRNGLYRPLNAAAVATVTQTLRTGGGTQILEVGAGTGGATSHLLAEWPRDLASTYDYTVTDTSASLLAATRRTQREQAPSNVRLEFRRFNFDLPDDQGLTRGSFDLVLAVNALHNAADLPLTLRNLRSLLRPGGTLVLSESLCAPGDLVHQELIFNLLPLPADAYRRGSRFYAEAMWRAHFDAAEIDATIQVNAMGPELVMVASATKGQP